MPQQTGSATILGMFPSGGTNPTFTYDELPVSGETTWAVHAINASITLDREMVPQTDSNGKVIGFIFGEAKKKIEVTAKVKASSNADAIAAYKALPAGTKLVAAGFIEATDNTQFDGAYIIEPGFKLELSDSETEPAKITFSAIQYETAAATLLSTIA
jgi:uncharacterized protein YuzE